MHQRPKRPNSWDIPFGMELFQFEGGSPGGSAFRATNGGGSPWGVARFAVGSLSFREIAHETGHSALECTSDQSAPNSPATKAPPTRGTYPSEWNFFNSRGGPLGGQLFGPPMDGGSPLGGSPGHRICYLWRNRR